MAGITIKSDFFTSGSSLSILIEYSPSLASTIGFMPTYCTSKIGFFPAAARKSFASLCIGAFLLAECGLINGKKCSTHWAYYNEFRQRFPEVEIVDGSVITDEGRIYSSGGANSLWNLLLYLLEKYTDRGIAIQLSKYFGIDIDRSSQSAFTIFTGQKDHSEPETLTAHTSIEENYTEKITIDELADKV